MSIINSYFQLQSGIYFDSSAFVLFVGLLVSHVQNNKGNFNKTNLILGRILLFGAITSALNFLLNFAPTFIPVNSFTIFLFYTLKYVEMLFAVLLFETVSLYFYYSSGIKDIVHRNKVLYVVNFTYFVISLLFVFANLFMKNIFYFDEALKLNAGNFYHLYILILIGFQLKDVIVSIAYNKYLADKKVYWFLLLYFMNILFLVNKCFMPSATQCLFIFAISQFIVVSYSQKQNLTINPLFNANSYNAFYNDCNRILTMTSNASICMFKICNYQNLKLYLGQGVYMEMLRTISTVIKTILAKNRIYGTVYYLGHGIFALRIPGNSSRHIKNNIFSIINKMLTQDLNVQNTKVLCDVQMCIVEIPKDIKSIDYLKEFARKFSHIIPKTEGITYLSDISKDNEFKIKNHMREIVESAIVKHHFEVFYHPVYSVEEKRFISAEAELRINDPDFGIIIPDYFIPFAEQNGYMRLIGTLTFEEVCKFIASPEYKNSGLKYISLYLTANECIQFNFRNKVTSLMSKYEVTTEEIQFIITEKITVNHSELIERKICELNQEGFHFSLDGYGTGYSNIKKMISLPFDMVNLDDSLVKKSSDPQMKVVLDSILRMFYKLDKKVLVKGVDTAELKNQFENINCDGVQLCRYMQGKYFSEPLNAVSLMNFLKEKNQS